MIPNRLLLALLSLGILCALAAPQQSAPNSESPLETRREHREERGEQRQGEQSAGGDEQEAERRGDTGESEEVDEAQDAKPERGDYKSRYSLQFKYPIAQLLFDHHSERGSAAFERSTPEREWYSEAVRTKNGGWGVDCSNFSGWNYNWGLGIHLRPFKKNSWYHKSFSHAHRWVE
ncbi:MAG: hypothetical protein FJ292_05775 [Planctomycetes bacterium]|nr:hypothetical protein [Planctomycetota bacterium]